MNPTIEQLFSQHPFLYTGYNPCLHTSKYPVTHIAVRPNTLPVQDAGSSVSPLTHIYISPIAKVDIAQLQLLLNYVVFTTCDTITIAGTPHAVYCFVVRNHYTPAFANKPCHERVYSYT